MLFVNAVSPPTTSLLESTATAPGTVHTITKEGQVSGILLARVEHAQFSQVQYRLVCSKKNRYIAEFRAYITEGQFQVVHKIEAVNIIIDLVVIYTVINLIQQYNPIF